MPRKKTKTLTELELGIMQVIWRIHAATVQEVQDALAVESRRLAPSSIRTMLGILVNKGYLTRRQDGRGYVYSPAVEKSEADRRILKDLLDRAFKGSVAGLMAALFNTRTMSKEDLDEAKTLIREHEKRGDK